MNTLLELAKQNGAYATHPSLMCNPEDVHIAFKSEAHLLNTINSWNSQFNKPVAIVEFMNKYELDLITGPKDLHIVPINGYVLKNGHKLFLAPKPKSLALLSKLVSFLTSKLMPK